MSHTLFDPTTGTIADRFRRFHEANPHVFRLFCDLAIQARREQIRKGVREPRYSADAIVQEIRWKHYFNVETSEPFKLSDHFTAEYARMAMEVHSDTLDGFFETRKRRSA